MIWAQARGAVIGAEGTMPWHLPEDLAHFKAVTSGHPVIMGRATWDSLPPRFRPLPGRRNIVLTRDTSWSAPGAEVAHSADDALALARAFAGTPHGGEAWVTGGAQIYRAMLPHADICVVTDIDGDTTAPEPGSDWVSDSGNWLVSERTGLRYRFRTLRRAPTAG
ncbi:MAG: dihydrofolate reductase [Tomitella sp.]|nr:dihydrofolate reductase [Tomitella sp.]